jgi:methionine-rich copper-binding protein CopC
VNRGALRALAVSLLCGLALLLGSAPASAHALLEKTDPADGSTLDAAPTAVSLTFNENIPAEFSTLTVIGPDGAAYQTGPVTAANGTISTQVLPLGPAGRYQIGYRIVSDDGHPVSGSVAFTMSTAGTGTGTAPAPADPSAPSAGAAPAGAPADGGPPVWPWIVGAVVLVGAGVVAALRLGRG